MSGSMPIIAHHLFYFVESLVMFIFCYWIKLRDPPTLLLFNSPGEAQWLTSISTRQPLPHFLSNFVLFQQSDDPLSPQRVRRVFQLKEVSWKQVPAGSVHILSLLSHQRAQCPVSGQDLVVKLHPPFGILAGHFRCPPVWAKVIPLIDSVRGEEVGHGAKPQRHDVCNPAKQCRPAVEPEHLLQDHAVHPGPAQTEWGDSCAENRPSRLQAGHFARYCKFLRAGGKHERLLESRTSIAPPVHCLTVDENGAVGDSARVGSRAVKVCWDANLGPCREPRDAGTNRMEPKGGEGGETLGWADTIILDHLQMTRKNLIWSRLSFSVDCDILFQQRCFSLMTLCLNGTYALGVRILCTYNIRTAIRLVFYGQCIKHVHGQQTQYFSIP